MAETDPVVAGQVGAGLGRGDDVIGRYPITGMGQGNLHHLGTRLAQGRNAVPYRRLDLGVKSFLKVLAGNPHPQPFDPGGQGGRVIPHRPIHRGGIAAVIATDGLQEDGAIADILAHRPQLVEGRGVGNQTIAGDPPIGGFQTDDPAVRGGLADRAASIGAQGAETLIGRHRRRRSATGTAADPAEIPGIFRNPIGAGLGGRAHGELIHGELPEDHRPGGLQLLDRRRVVWRHKIFQHPRAAGGAQPLGADDVLEGQRHPEQFAGFPGRPPPVGRGGLGQGAFAVEGGIGAHPGFDLIDPRQHRLGGRLRRNLAPGQPGFQLVNTKLLYLHGLLLPVPKFPTALKKRADPVSEGIRFLRSL